MLDHEVWKEIVMSVRTTYRSQDDDDCDWFIWETASSSQNQKCVWCF